MKTKYPVAKAIGITILVIIGFIAADALIQTFSHFMQRLM